MGLGPFLFVNDSWCSALGAVQLCVNPALPPGLARLVVGERPHTTDHIAGLPVEYELAAGARPTTASTRDESSLTRADAFALRVVGVDHVVVAADDVLATCNAIEAESGSPLRRVKEGERGTQGFFRWGEVILEVVERRLVQPSTPTPRPPSYWGFVLTVENLDDAVAYLGPDVLGAAKPAVQAGRRIATFRSGVGLGVPLALMSE